MGQQQLLLVILVTIIVGIATVVAINTFGSAADSANLDAVRNDVAQIAASAQAYYMKPTMMAGGGNSFEGITFQDIAFGADELDTSDYLAAVNSNGMYEIAISGTNNEILTITAYPSSVNTISGTNTPSGESLAATVTADEMTWTDNSIEPASE